MNEGDSSLLCPVCKSDVFEISFSERSLLHRHIQEEHGYVQCEVCPVTVFVAPDSRDQHNSKHHPLKRKHQPAEQGRSRRKLARLEEEDSPDVDLNSLTDGEFSQPAKYTKDPLKGFFLQTILECAECPERPTRKFSSYNAWLLHLRSSHKYFSCLADYKTSHGDPSVVKFKHHCRLCGLELFLNLTIVKRHLAVQHGTSVSQYLSQFREELVAEKMSRPVVAPSQSLAGWWEGCMYSCRLCQFSAQSHSAFETHLCQAHQISGQAEIEERPSEPDQRLLENWYDCSEHVCRICDKSFWSNLRFHWHIKRDHGIKSTKDYRAEHGDPEVVLRQHKCQICHNLIKWEASRIRDHLKAHKNVGDKMSLKEYGDQFRDVILAELRIIKRQAGHEEPAVSSQPSLVVKEGHTLKGEAPHGGYSVAEWKELFGKKVNPDDKVECSLCQKVMNRHSYNRHQDRHHKGILNMRDLTRLKRKQLQLARSGVIKTLSELMRLAGGVTVCRGKGDNKEEVNIEEEEQESKLNMYKAGLSLDQIEKKMILINSGLTIT